MERPKKQYNTKYSGLTAEEYREMLYRKNKERRENMTEDEKKHLRELYDDWVKRQPTGQLSKYHGGKCETCDKEYADIYQHYKTKKHIEAVTKHTTENNVNALLSK